MGGLKGVLAQERPRIRDAATAITLNSTERRGPGRGLSERRAVQSGAGSWHVTSDLRARACQLEWVEKAYAPNPTQNTLQKRRYTLDLSKLPVDFIQSGPAGRRSAEAPGPAL